MKLFALTSALLILPCVGNAFCGANYSQCPDPPVQGACNINCAESTAVVPAAPQNTDHVYVEQKACVTVPEDRTIRDVGYGLYDNSAGGSWWQYRDFTNNFTSGGQYIFCITGANQASYERYLYIRAWYK